MTPTGASPDVEREKVARLVREWDATIARPGPPANDPRNAALVEIGNAMRNRLSALSSDRRVEDMRERCAQQCLAVSGIVGARHGSSIDSALREAASAIRSLPVGGEG